MQISLDAPQTPVRVADRMVNGRVGPEPEYRITISDSDEGFFAAGDPETRSPPKAWRFMPRVVSRYFLNQISSPGFSLAHSAPIGLSHFPRLDFFSLSLFLENKYLW